MFGYFGPLRILKLVLVLVFDLGLEVQGTVRAPMAREFSLVEPL